MEADEGAVSEEEPEGQGGEQFVQVAAALQAWWRLLDPGSLGEADRCVRRGMGEGVLPAAGVGSGFQPGHQIRNSANSRDETHWDAILEAVKLFKQTHGRFPRSSGGDAEERRLYDWLQNNFDTTSSMYTPERANKLVLAFGDRWQAERVPMGTWPSPQVHLGHVTRTPNPDPV